MSEGDREILGVTASPVRAEPSHLSERVTEWVCGEVLRIQERHDGWIRARGPDGYEGWVTAGSTLFVGHSEAERWQRSATLWSLGTDLLPDDPRSPLSEVELSEGGQGLPANRLPWGARVEPSDGGRVRLPTGARAIAREPGRLIREEERADRFPPNGQAVVRSALEWLGAPYAWGGRRRSGVDCSGFVQAVYALHGVALPRDSDPQRRAGVELGIDSDRWRELQPGDLLFFAPEGKGISHVAISLGSSRILHAAASNGRVALDDLGQTDVLSWLRDSIVAGTRPLAR